VIGECLKLTAYFGERQRVGSRFYADELLDIFGHRELATSVLLRGVAGFGLRHRLRSDVSLSMSEDPPVMAIAVDTRARIEAILDEVAHITTRGLLTLERARMWQGPIGHVDLPESLHEATKLTIYVGRQERVGDTTAFMAVCDLLHRCGVDGASVLVGVDGTVHGRRERAGFFDRNAEVPAIVVAVGAEARIAAALPELEALLRRPLLTVERVRTCKRDGELYARPHDLPETDDRGHRISQKLTVFTSESQLYDGEPIHRALVRRLRASSASGATAVRGVWGYHGDHPPHGDRLFQLGRRVPVATVIVDSPEAIAASFDIVDDVTRAHGLVTSEMVPAALHIDGGQTHGSLELARHTY
jgi:PII-like signaling protein